MSMPGQTDTAATDARIQLVDEKLAMFEGIVDEFAACFRYVQDVHGQRRFETFPVAHSVRYLHALWLCECKDLLLSVPTTIARYEGTHCLELLLGWQAGETARVVAFLHRKLDMLPLVDLTERIEEAVRGEHVVLAKRLTHGRRVMMNRSFNLDLALDAIFAVDPAQLIEQVSAASADLGHTPEQIERQLAEMRSPLNAFVPHPMLARRNMMLMNGLGVAISDNPADRPGERTDRVAVTTMPARPYADMEIAGATTLLSLASNDPTRRDSRAVAHLWPEGWAWLGLPAG